MSLSAHDAIRHIEHTLASDSVPGVGAMRILNDAGQFLVNMHNWRWLESQQATLDLLQDTDYVWLPDNFRELVAVQTEDGINAGVQMTTQQQLLRLRSMSAANSYVYHAAVTHAMRQEQATGTLTFDSSTQPTTNSIVTLDDKRNAAVQFKFVASAGTDTDVLRHVVKGTTTTATAQAFTDAVNATPTLYMRAADTATQVSTLTYTMRGSAGNSATQAQTTATVNITFSAGTLLGGRDGGTPQPRLDIWPAPSADSLGGLLVYYRGGWLPVTNDKQMLYLPEWMETLYLLAVRAFARGYEREGDGTVNMRLADIKQGPIFMAAQQRDKEMTPNLGPMSGGAVQGLRASYDYFWNFSSTAGPS